MELSYPNLSQVNLSQVNLSQVNLSQVNLSLDFPVLGCVESNLKDKMISLFVVVLALKFIAKLRFPSQTSSEIIVVVLFYI